MNWVTKYILLTSFYLCLSCSFYDFSTSYRDLNVRGCGAILLIITNTDQNIPVDTFPSRPNSLFL